MEEAEILLKELFEVENKVVIEDFLEGFEFSMIAMVNEDIVIPLELAQDHKRAYDDDKGPNTGGMGCYSPLNKVDKETEKEALEKVFFPMVNGMKKDGIPFKGFLFAGLMKTIEGVKGIEFNARLGDPETQVILPRLQSDFVEVILELLDKKERKLKWDERTTIGVVMAGKDYPNNRSVGAKIEIDESINSILYHMGTKIENGKLVTNGGRVLTVVSFGETLEKAQKNVYNEVNKISCKELMFRKDIGNKGVARFGFLRQGDNPENFFGNNRYYMFNVNQGFLIVNKTKNRIIWAPSFYQGLEIYDCKQRPLIKINAPGNMPFKYKVPYGNLVAFDSKIPFTYRNFCTESDSFFVTYVGDYMVKGDETKNFDSYIFRFDWNGNLLNVYHSPVYLGTLTRSSDGKYFYGRGLDSSGTVVLYRLSCL